MFKEVVQKYEYVVETVSEESLMWEYSGTSGEILGGREEGGRDREEERAGKDRERRERGRENGRKKEP